MSATLRYVGLDVHKDSIVIAVAEDGVQHVRVRVGGGPFEEQEVATQRLRGLHGLGGELGRRPVALGAHSRFR